MLFCLSLIVKFPFVCFKLTENFYLFRDNQFFWIYSCNHLIMLKNNYLSNDYHLYCFFKIILVFHIKALIFFFKPNSFFFHFFYFKFIILLHNDSNNDYLNFIYPYLLQVFSFKKSWFFTHLLSHLMIKFQIIINFHYNT